MFREEGRVAAKTCILAISSLTLWLDLSLVAVVWGFFYFLHYSIKQSFSPVKNGITCIKIKKIWEEQKSTTSQDFQSIINSVF